MEGDGKLEVENSKALSVIVNSADISDNLSTFLQESPCGAMVQRLARGPFKAEIRVRFPLALPKITLA